MNKNRGRKRIPFLEASYLEDLTTAAISEMIMSRVQAKGIAPKTANRYREVLSRLFSWAMEQRGVRMPGGKNPARKVEKYKERAPRIRFLTLRQVREQMEALEDNAPLQTIVAVYIYAGLRREEALWLRLEDVDLRAGTYGMIRVRAKTVNGKYWEPKTKVNRAIPISSSLRFYLDR